MRAVRAELEIDDYSRAALWKHSVAVALCGKLIYRREFRLRGENIYAAGLLHDIGIIIEDQFRHAQLKPILRAKKTYEGNMPPAEKAVLGSAMPR
jgi:HD superfamily phosphodiesterase